MAFDSHSSVILNKKRSRFVYVDGHVRFCAKAYVLLACHPLIVARTASIDRWNIFADWTRVKVRNLLSMPIER